MDVREKLVTGMADMMNFPKRWEDFLHDYEFEDARRIYTNGSRLIPSFRVKQMMEHYAPVRHGHWISLTECANEGVYCSICKKKVWKSDYAWCNKKSRNKLQSNYCPNCGAKMDGGERMTRGVKYDKPKYRR